MPLDIRSWQRENRAGVRHVPHRPAQLLWAAIGVFGPWSERVPPPRSDEPLVSAKDWLQRKAREGAAEMAAYGRGGLIDLQNAVTQAFPDSQQQASVPQVVKFARWEVGPEGESRVFSRFGVAEKAAVDHTAPVL